MPSITMNYGYDIHRIRVDVSILEKIKFGEVVEIDGQGFAHEDEGLLIDHWVFNRFPDEVLFWLDNGSEYHGQELWIDEGT